MQVRAELQGHTEEEVVMKRRKSSAVHTSAISFVFIVVKHVVVNLTYNNNKVFY